VSSQAGYVSERAHGNAADAAEKEIFLAIEHFSDILRAEFGIIESHNKPRNNL
jgi:hypothetical protein